MQTPPPNSSREPSPFARSRSVSVSSDMTSRNFQSTPPSVEPSPAYIAASEASQIVSVELEQNALIPIPDGHNDIVSAGSLALLNAFLDYLLFNILAVAKSTQLNDLRPAIADVLKPRLAKEVVSAAEDELRDYMGGDPEDELQEFRGGQKPNGEFDLIRSWKLTRLRCMVYTRLGNMEEEEEAEYISLEAPDDPSGTPRRFSSHAGNITPAAAIFLTSIIEFLGEHALVVAGENAGNRLMSIRANREDINIRVTVEEVDMEKLALNSTLGRLWRTWKMRVRPPTLSRTLSRESFSRRALAGTPTVMDESITQDPPHEEAVEEESSQAEPPNPADIALPINDNDVNEIEIPGLWVNPEENTDADAAVSRIVRTRSLCHQSTRPTETSPGLNTSSHHRSRSLPSHVFKQMPSEVKTSEASEEKDEEEEKEEDAVLAQDVETAVEPEVENPRAPSKAESLEILERKSQGLVIAGQAGATAEVAEENRNSQLIETQVVEGQGTYQVPKLSSITAQRPRRKSTKETRPKEISASPAVQDADVPTNYCDDHPSPTQGAAATPHVKPNLIHAKANYLDDRSRSHTPTASAPTSHPRQLDTNPEGSAEDLSDDRTRRSFNANRRTASPYTESIAPPRSVSEDSEGSIYRSRTPSYAASHAPSPNGQYRHNLGDNSPGLERAAVQRVHLGSTTSQASTKSRRSESISEKRPLTSGSATSTVSNKWKLLIGRHPAETDVPLPGRARQSSEASTPVEDVIDEPSLDDLIKSDETIHFTLTPRNMRQMESPSSPRYSTARNDLIREPSGTAELADFLKTTAPPGERSPTTPVDRPLPSPTVSTQNPPVNGLRAHPPGPSALPPASPASLGSRRSRGTMYQARDARTAGNSVRDFADFIRSTGPSGASPASASRPSESSLRGQHRNDSPSAIARPDTAQSGSSRKTAKPGDAPNSPRKNTPRLQAREAAGNAGNKTSDLIDFIREGPPGASTHRIPRTVAPFRNTMDSEELMSMDTVVTSNTTSATSVSPSLASTRAESTNPASNHSMASSRAPLLENNNPSDAPPPIPPRKRRGPRDPYAIDDSDDDLEELTETPKPAAKPQRKEESMLDFLNSVPPPVNDKPPEPFILSSNAVPPKSSNGSSGFGLKGRFRRNPSVDKFPLPKKSTTSMRSARLLTDNSNIPAVPQVSATVSSPTSHVGSQSGKFPVGNSGFIAHSGQGSRPAAQTATPLARPTRPTETSALADFLKNTGPPEPPVRAPTAMSEERKDSTFSKIFRRKKVDY
ncbi:Collagen alpha-2(I) chain [Talaromyces islandicus]|uniref:Collagen alpha-2(I) chain n=1 Tax=Talaromyces islandicus TaxID=28573 RepID=A0A0U1LVL2_TALIS|nr:Collagen alpha-2(I) chain [Talaromyces islandicus]